MPNCGARPSDLGCRVFGVCFQGFLVIAKKSTLQVLIIDTILAGPLLYL